MGRYNSSLTRVQPVFDALQHQDTATWLAELWRMAATTKQGAVPPPAAIGALVPGKVYERALPPSTAFLRWMVRHPPKLTIPAHYGATSEAARRQRARLFDPDAELHDGRIRVALQAIEAHGGAGSARQWWAFEGFTHVDACFETNECLLLIEGKRTELVSASTRWFASRNQSVAERRGGAGVGRTPAVRLDPRPGDRRGGQGCADGRCCFSGQ